MAIEQRISNEQESGSSPLVGSAYPVIRSVTTVENSFLIPVGRVPIVHGAPAKRREPELVPGDNLPTVSCPCPQDAYLHVLVPDLTADDLRLDGLLIYLYKTRSL